jgi:hypothetical protein
MTYTRGKEVEMDFSEAKAIHRRETRRVGQGLTYRGKGAKAMGEEYLDEVIEAEEVLEAAWDPTTMSWKQPTTESERDDETSSTPTDA